MYLKQLPRSAWSAVMMLSGGVVASGTETKNDSETTLVTPYEYSAAVETLAASGVAAGSATALQAADGCAWPRSPARWRKAKAPCP